MSQEKFNNTSKNNLEKKEKGSNSLPGRAAKWLSKEWKKSLILGGTGLVSLSSLASTKDIKTEADNTFLSKENKIELTDTVKPKEIYQYVDGKLTMIYSKDFGVGTSNNKKEETKKENTQKEPKKDVPNKKSKTNLKNEKVKTFETHNKLNEAGFGDREQEYFNSAKQGEIQDRKLIRENIPNKGVYSTIDELKEAIKSHNVFYQEVEAGSGKHWDLTNKEKLEKGGHFYNSEEEINKEKILNQKTGEMVPKHNPKQVDLKIDGKFYPIVLLENEYIAPAPKDMMALEDVVGGRGYVVWKKGTLAIFGLVNKNGKECYTPKWQYTCGNPIMDNEVISE